MEIRTRLAPSPTGLLHVGNARAGIFNYLFTKKHNGKFILRIEDTDVNRSKKEYEKDARESLLWLGLEWDEFYRQSDRKEVYTKYIKILLESGFAYVSREEGDGKGEVIRFKNPGKIVTFKDIIRGEIDSDTKDLGDFIIAKDEKTPLYHFAVVVDDEEMKISHVIRGEDHIPNTPRQILIQEALGFSRPFYAHLPLLLGQDRSKLGKRHGAEALSQYRKMGYLPEAMFNFLALLGWHPVDDKEIMSKEELIERFTLERVQRGGAIFDKNKLDWISKEYMKNMPYNDFVKTAKQYIPEEWAPLFKDRVSRFSDLTRESKFLTKLTNYSYELLLWKDSPSETAKRHLANVVNIISAPEDNVGEKIMSYAKENGKGEVLWPLRVALSGLKNSPGPIEILKALGEEESIRRIKVAILKLS